MDSLEKAIRALVLIQMRELPQPEQVRLLSTAGYKPVEIAELLGIKPNTAAKLLQRDRKSK